MQVIEVDGDRRFRLVQSNPPAITSGQVIVDVRAVSINRGEVLRARAAGAGVRPGWDFAGVVREGPAKAGLGPGTRVAGYLSAGAWAQTLAVPARHIAVIPDGVSDAVAATLPVAGLTALGALDAGGNLVGRKVLVTGASGGVGSFAVHLATQSGAQVTALVRRPAEECRHLFPAGTRIVSAQDNLDEVRANGPFDLVVESLGGRTLGQAMSMLASTGKCVTLGVTDEVETTFDAEQFFMTGSATLQGYVLFRDRLATPAEGLERLFRLSAAGRLDVEIGLSDSWENIEAVAEKLISRSFLGKAVLTVGGDEER